MECCAIADASIGTPLLHDSIYPPEDDNRIDLAPTSFEDFWPAFLDEGRQFSEGFSTLSMTMVSPGPLAPSSFKPSCSCNAVKIEGAVGSPGSSSSALRIAS